MATSYIHQVTYKLADHPAFIPPYVTEMDTADLAYRLADTIRTKWDGIDRASVRVVRTNRRVTLDTRSIEEIESNIVA